MGPGFRRDDGIRRDDVLSPGQLLCQPVRFISAMPCCQALSICLPIEGYLLLAKDLSASGAMVCIASAVADMISFILADDRSARVRPRLLSSFAFGHSGRPFKLSAILSFG